MVGIKDVATYLPSKRLDALSRLDEFGIDADFVENKTGMLRLAVKESEQDTADLCVEAWDALSSKAGVEADELDCLVVCTQNPEGSGLPHTSAVVHGRIGAGPQCACFDISLGCSGFVYSLSIVKAFMEANGFGKGVVITADPYSKIVDPADKNTALLFGDGAAATLLTDDPVWRVGSFSFGTRGSDSGALCVTEPEHRLHMNGRGVFSLSATIVPPDIGRTLEKNGLTKEDVDLFLLHQGSRYIVDTIRTRLGVPAEKVPFGAAEYGNTVSSSIPFLLENVEESAKTLVLSGFGVGFSWATTVIQKNGE